MTSQLEQLTIGLDARSIHAQTRRGTGKNLIDLYTNVLKLNPGWRVIGYHRDDDSLGIDHPNYIPRRIEMPGDRVNAWFRWRLPYASMRDHVDLMHYPANLCPNWLPTPTLLTVHDLLPLNADNTMARQFRQSLKTAKQRRLNVITPSAYTARQLAQQHGIESDQVTVNHWAPDSGMSHITDLVEHRLLSYRYGVSRPYLLHFGAPEARKNTAKVIEAFSHISPRIRKQVQLLIVGIDNPTLLEQFRNQAESLGIEDRELIIHGFADEADLSALYSFACALVYPSLSEGFGLPIVDAFLTQLPVICSQTTSLPEVAGNAAVFVNPESTAQITQAMQLIISDEALRERLIERGTERLNIFNWKATTQRFVKAVERTTHTREVRRAA